jgi:GTPase Era involved in 16S rRNA processing
MFSKNCIFIYTYTHTHTFDRLLCKNKHVKAIVIGSKGSTVAWIREQAERDICDYLQRDVTLKVIVQ